jgi:hypothetical protein
MMASGGYAGFDSKEASPLVRYTALQIGVGASRLHGFVADCEQGQAVIHSAQMRALKVDTMIVSACVDSTAHRLKSTFTRCIKTPRLTHPVSLHMYQQHAFVLLVVV